MLKLHGGDIVDEVAPERRQHPEIGSRRNETAVHQRPGVVSLPRPQAGDETAQRDLSQHREDHQGGNVAQHRRHAFGDSGATLARREPDQGGQRHRRQQQMRRQPLLSHLDPARQPRTDHPPTDETLQTAERENPQHLPFQAARQHVPRPENDQRDKQREAEQPADQPVRPFPEEDRLEATEVHIGKQRLILRNLLVPVESLLPPVVREGRDHAGQRFPLGDRKPGLGQPRRAADDNHQQHERRDAPKPDRDSPAATADVGNRHFADACVREREFGHRGERSLGFTPH